MKQKFTKDEKLTLVHSFNSGELISTLCQESGVPRSTLYHWIKIYKPLYSVDGTPNTQKDFNDISRKYEKQSKILEVIKVSGYNFNMSLDEKLEIYHSFKDQYSSRILCEALNISRGTYHNRIVKAVEPTFYQKRKTEITTHVLKVFEESEQRFGSDKILYTLQKMGIKTSKKYILAIMREHGLQSISCNSKKQHRSLQPKRNVIARNFDVSRPNEVWVSDVTCFKLKDYYIYVCAILDLYSRKIVSYNISQNQTTQFITKTFKAAFISRNSPSNLTFHSDRGIQYTSNAFRLLLKQYGVTQSFSGVANPHDNAVIESFFAILKKEEIYRRNYKSEKEFRDCISIFIEYYNNIRPHGYNNNITPTDKELAFY